MAVITKKKTSRFKAKHAVLLLGTVAAILLCVGLFDHTPTDSPRHLFVDSHLPIDSHSAEESDVSPPVTPIVTIENISPVPTLSLSLEKNRNAARTTPVSHSVATPADSLPEISEIPRVVVADVLKESGHSVRNRDHATDVAISAFPPTVIPSITNASSLNLQGLGESRWPYFIHFHKAGGTTLCHQARAVNGMNVPLRNCNLPGDGPRTLETGAMTLDDWFPFLLCRRPKYRDINF
jgi:hypothetical protein